MGLEEFLATDNIKLVAWPNPVSDILHVQLSGTGDHALQLFNSQGQRVYEKQIPKSGDQIFQININDFPSGIYFVVLTDQNNVTTGKVIKN